MRNNKTQQDQGVIDKNHPLNSESSIESLSYNFKKNQPPIYGWNDYFFFTPHLFMFSPDIPMESISNDDLITLIHRLPCFFDENYRPANEEIIDRIRWMMIARQNDDFDFDQMTGGAS